MILIEEKVTDTHVYFWGDPTLSNFGPSEFDYHGHRFLTSEQAYMWEKAVHFDDFEIANKILEAETPREAKNLGRKVKNYNDKEWAAVRFDYMVDVCMAKFEQNPHRLETLMWTGNRILVEGSPYDKIWGVGLHWTDEKILDEKNWDGQNLLGKALMKVRESFYDIPNPDSKVTTAELMLELGHNIDEALDIHNEVERLGSHVHIKDGSKKLRSDFKTSGDGKN